mmetsp:Transcript_54712/g.175497  ORF Transcript_54712/g.175497 Transcript_54712/m.175497 type:complete len:242 (+) Transcript_54712:189-914(+)
MSSAWRAWLPAFCAHCAACPDSLAPAGAPSSGAALFRVVPHSQDYWPVPGASCVEREFLPRCGKLFGVCGAEEPCRNDCAQGLQDHVEDTSIEGAPEDDACRGDAEGNGGVQRTARDDADCQAAHCDARANDETCHLRRWGFLPGGHTEYHKSQHKSEGDLGCRHSRPAEAAARTDRESDAAHDGRIGQRTQQTGHELAGHVDTGFTGCDLAAAREEDCQSHCGVEVRARDIPNGVYHAHQ